MDYQVKELKDALLALNIPVSTKNLIFFDPRAIQLESLEAIPEEYFAELDCFFIPVNLRDGLRIQDVVMAIKKEELLIEKVFEST